MPLIRFIDGEAATNARIDAGDKSWIRNGRGYYGFDSKTDYLSHLQLEHTRLDRWRIPGIEAVGLSRYTELRLKATGVLTVDGLEDWIRRGRQSPHISMERQVEMRQRLRAYRYH